MLVFLCFRSSYKQPVVYIEINNNYSNLPPIFNAGLDLNQ